MANVLLTTKCNLKCPYCFAQERLSDGHKLTMSKSDAERIIDFLKRSHHPYFRAMGGEPTLHPDFPYIVEKALQADLRVDVLSNATWPESYNRFFQRISPRRLYFLLNVDHPDRYLPKIWERIQANLAAVAGRGSVTLSFNLFEKQPRYEYILDLCRGYGIHNVRLSLSLPVVGANNACLKMEDYKLLSPYILEFVRRAEAEHIQVRMDNAVPLCMFSYEQAGELLLKGVIDLQRNTRCSPVIDIGPDLRVWCCFCLSKMWNRHLDEFQSLEEIHAYYRRAMGLYQSRLYPLEECDQCSYRELWNCQGGCLTHTVMKYGELALEDQSAPALAHCSKTGAMLALSPDTEIRRYDLPETSYAVFNKATGMELEVDATFAPLLDSLNGEHSAEQVVDQYLHEAQNAQADGLLQSLAQEMLKQSTNELLAGLLHQGFVEEHEAEVAVS